jgi:hypothetical protein
MNVFAFAVHCVIPTGGLSTDLWAVVLLDSERITRYSEKANVSGRQSGSGTRNAAGSADIENADWPDIRVAMPNSGDLSRSKPLRSIGVYNRPMF